MDNPFPMRFYQNAGAPAAGVNAVQTLTIGGTPTGGTYTITLGAYTSGAIAFNVTNVTHLAAINAALDAMPNVGAGGIVATAGTIVNGTGIGTVVLTAAANLTFKPLTLMLATSSLTGTVPTAVIANTTTGVSPVGRGDGECIKGVQLVDSVNGISYVNTGTVLAPVWTKIGTQT